jgi:hypothetical protein
MSDFFDRVLARAGGPISDAELVRAGPRAPEPFEGERGADRMPILAELRPGSTSFRSVPSGSGTEDPFAAPPAELRPAAAAPDRPDARVSAPAPVTPLPVGPGTRLTTEVRAESHELVREQREIHHRHTEVVHRQEVSPVEPDRPPMPPGSPVIPTAGPRSDPARPRTAERPENRRARNRPPERVVEVRIGRIEVLAPAPPQARRPDTRTRPEPRISLQDYLSGAAADRRERSTG